MPEPTESNTQSQGVFGMQLSHRRSCQLVCLLKEKTERATQVLLLAFQLCHPANFLCPTQERADLFSQRQEIRSVRGPGRFQLPCLGQALQAELANGVQQEQARLTFGLFELAHQVKLQQRTYPTQDIACSCSGLLHYCLDGRKLAAVGKDSKGAKELLLGGS